MKSGAIFVYDQSTCQERLVLQHKAHGEDSLSVPHVNAKVPQAVRLLAFDSSDMRLASASTHSICVWSIGGELLHMFLLQDSCVLLEFSPEQNGVIGVTRSSQIFRWNLLEAEEELFVPRVYIRRQSPGNTRQEKQVLPCQAPLAAAVSPDRSLLALLYRGRPIYLYNLEDDAIIGQCGRDVGSKVPNISVQTALFNPNPELNLLAVAYQDGELAIYDSCTQNELVKVDGDAYSLAASPDGRTLGSGNTRGTINLWDFQTLCLLYSIKSGLDEVRRLSFTGDGLRVVDIRDSRTKIWEPSALVRRSVEEDANMSDAAVLDAPVVGANDDIISITAMCPDETGEFVFAGRDDGSVVAYAVSTGLFHSEVHSHSHGMLITKIAFQNGLLASADVGGRTIM
ncbi:hypothetical protein AYL99_02087 [Fonsecaea erecta]|uniref:Uncharacterized protein n=1 Tax=Fonsecaea erecta TaxID=1367422 RepID=A0A178ZST1_9EURO|nr:hypothetical protein AYL99_02087 [Fonsecaea erecta]OAP62860.1 hypothetical protein AYL99_02087 [Fonsecaea erecta]